VGVGVVKLSGERLLQSSIVGKKKGKGGGTVSEKKDQKILGWGKGREGRLENGGLGGEEGRRGREKGRHGGMFNRGTG
jgi:hypothetical protein